MYNLFSMPVVYIDNRGQFLLIFKSIFRGFLTGVGEPNLRNNSSSFVVFHLRSFLWQESVHCEWLICVALTNVPKKSAKHAYCVQREGGKPSNVENLPNVNYDKNAGKNGETK
jgi:hypothetical protein